MLLSLHSKINYTIPRTIEVGYSKATHLASIIRECKGIQIISDFSYSGTGSAEVNLNFVPKWFGSSCCRMYHRRPSVPGRDNFLIKSRQWSVSECCRFRFNSTPPHTPCGTNIRTRRWNCLRVRPNISGHRVSNLCACWLRAKSPGPFGRWERPLCVCAYDPIHHPTSRVWALQGRNASENL